MNSSPSLWFIEGSLALLSLALAYVLPAKTPVWWRAVERALAQLASRRRLAVGITGMLALLLRLALLPVCPIPLPFIPDEFSFLFAADTFAHGRLANPTPALWQHFETIHISMQPTYTSMYFPAQGLILAAGKVLLGNPWFGLLCVNALLCAAICWALQAWLPSRWALLGGLIAVLRLSLFSYWINSYNGAGAIVALGGTLVLGAFPRVMRNMRLLDGLLLAAGIVILLLSRPYEGLLLCLPTAIVLLHWAFFSKNRPAKRVLMQRAALPLLVVAAGGAWLGYYNYRAFGHATTLPYTVDRAAYAVEPYWIWENPRPVPVYRHAAMRDFYLKQELRIATNYHTTSGFIVQNLLKPINTLRFYAGFALLPPLVMLPWVLGDRRIRFLILALVFLIAGVFLEIVLLPHYLAPFTVVFYGIGLQCMRHLYACRTGGRRVGQWIVRLAILNCIAMVAMRVCAQPLHIALGDWPVSEWTANWYGNSQLGYERDRIQNQLEQMPGKQLVFVRYMPQHNPVFEWVYNSADIEDARIIWARDMGAAANRELMHHYGNRTAWLIEPDQPRPALEPYQGAN